MMRNLRLKTIVAFIGFITMSVNGAVIAEIDGLRYAFRGDVAAVVNLYDYSNQNIYDHFIYSKSEYIIPPVITYLESNYVVDYIGISCFDSNNIYNIILPETIEVIGTQAFSGTRIRSMIIPYSVRILGSEYSSYHPFYGCDLLSTLIYTSKEAPENWVATSKTYVPDKEAYSTPKYKINDATIIEMITWHNVEFEYSGVAPCLPSYTNNMSGYDIELDVSSVSLEKMLVRI